ncbi:MAG: prephenate dehydrogenase [Janthinobacterium lividum]
MSTRVLILGTGLIGASLGLALKALGPAFEGTVLGWDANPLELAKAREMGALDELLPSREAAFTPDLADMYVLATPVLPILDWMERLAPGLGESQLVTDVGSTKQAITERAKALYNGPGQAQFLAGHPMAGKESGGAALAEAGLFRGATWLFCPGQMEVSTPQIANISPRIAEFRGWIEAIGARPRDLDPAQHDVLCAWVSHLPQILSTALAAVLEETFAEDAEGRALVEAIGGRALRETTRLGASPYSMWRDVALTNTEPLAATLFALEQRLAHLRENLRTPELREEFAAANRFRAK